MPNRFVSVLSFALVLVQPHGHAAVSLVLKDEAVVAGSAVRIADLVSGEYSLTPNYIANLVIGTAPRQGVIARVSRVQIEHAIRRIADEPIVWAGAKTVRVRASTQLISGQRIAEIARDAEAQHIGAQTPTAVVRVAAEVGDVTVRTGPYQLRVRPESLAMRQHLAVWVDVWREGRIERSVAVPVSISMPGQASYAAHDIPAGELVTTTDVVQRDLDLAVLKDAVLDPGTANGLRAKRLIRAGELLTARVVAPRGTVLRGDSVQVAVRAGAVWVESAGTAMGEARPGEELAVQTSNGHALSGRLMDGGLVVIK